MGELCITDCPIAVAAYGNADNMLGIAYLLHFGIALALPACSRYDETALSSRRILIMTEERVRSLIASMSNGEELREGARKLNVCFLGVVAVQLRP